MNTKTQTTNKKIVFPSKSGQNSVEDAKRRKEIRFALFVAVKTSVATVDSLTTLLNQEYKDTLRLKRSKCTALIKNVLAPFFREDLKKDIQDTPFSLLVDEATDISTTKYLGFAIRYFSESMQKIKSTYLGLSELKGADALSLSEAVQSTMQSWGLKGDNMVGLGTDGANVMKGEHHSLQSLLKQSIPHLVHISCICHSIDLIAKEAVNKALPSNIDFLIRESYNWFAHSSQRQAAFKEIFDLVGFSSCSGLQENLDTADGTQTCLKLISPCTTRWLVMADCTERILGQFDALSAHFTIVYEKQRCFQAKVLADMYKDERNLHLLYFIHPILKSLKRLSNMFQSNSEDNLKIYQEVQSYFMSLSKRVLVPAILRSNSSPESLSNLNIVSGFCFLPPEAKDLGDVFTSKLKNSKLSAEEKSKLVIIATSFLRELFVSFQKRLKGTIDIMSKVQQVYFKSYP